VVKLSPEKRWEKNPKSFFEGRGIENFFGIFDDDPPSLRSEIFSDGNTTRPKSQLENFLPDQIRTKENRKRNI